MVIIPRYSIRRAFFATVAAETQGIFQLLTKSPEVGSNGLIKEARGNFPGQGGIRG
jgi:hypothetical protein